MKKMTTLMTAALVMGTVIYGNSVFASSTASITPIAIDSEQTMRTEDTTDFIKISGDISELIESGDKLTIVVENIENKQKVHFPISEEVLLLDSSTTDKLQNKDLKKGVRIDVYYDKNKPIPMIYPATITPEVIIIKNKEMGQVKISKFDENFLSLDHELKLNLSDQIVLLSERGEELSQEELFEKELIVFFDVTTFSIPAQTSPQKIIALDNKDEFITEVQELIQGDHYIKEGVKMIPIRKVAEHLGYKVEWDPKTSSVLLSKQNQSFQISIGKVEYGFNRSMRYFEVKPEIKNGKSYIPDEFLKILVH